MSDNRTADIYASVVATLAAATISLVLRLVARRMTKVKIWWDDWYVIGAWVFALGWNFVVLLWSHQGLGRYKKDITHLTEEEILYHGNLLLYFGEILYAFSLAFSKFAILSFFWRMFKTSNIRWPIRILFICSVLWLVARTFIAIFHCWPVEAFWDKTIEDAHCPINDSEFFFGSVLAHLLIDIAILVLPVLQVRQLQLAIGQKIAVIGLFLFGVLVCVASIVVLVESARFDPLHPELPYNIAPIMVWATVEVNLAIISACLPMLRPIFRKLLPGSVLGSNGQSQHLSRPTMNGAVKLTTMGRSREDDESSSTYNLADPDNGKLPSHTTIDYENPVDGLMGPHTVISSRAREMSPSRDGPVDNRRSEGDRAGIVVRSEMTVQYTERDKA